MTSTVPTPTLASQRRYVCQQQDSLRDMDSLLYEKGHGGQLDMTCHAGRPRDLVGLECENGRPRDLDLVCENDLGYGLSPCESEMRERGLYRRHHHHHNLVFDYSDEALSQLEARGAIKGEIEDDDDDDDETEDEDTLVDGVVVDGVCDRSVTPPGDADVNYVSTMFRCGCSCCWRYQICRSVVSIITVGEYSVGWW